MLQVDALKKSYGNVVAVNGVSLRAGAGEIVGLLGPNGAGKTTTVSMIAGLVRPDSGSVKIEGLPLAGDTDPRLDHDSSTNALIRHYRVLRREGGSDDH